ncbi:hypothetical protein CLV24_104162 [Pontibacter ummariensis]|uniref:Uncharacterized protein n=1 Tax=Pontibacter ummariensis TaxID=1610492 RepID=A0A239DDC2_9BACT|nr:hypothetical protein [Pontibacter ummariensis]PRY14352.1 hypothetical protein CLV24_104162 [Pontibacter ummariensis]SNS29911.1 hypothetical protein SAMN06296052_104161 [Pontibacter ummariensis]
MKNGTIKNSIKSPMGIPRSVWDMWQRSGRAVAGAQPPKRLVLSSEQAEVVAAALLYAATSKDTTQQERTTAEQVLEQLDFSKSDIQALMKELR